MSGIYRFANDKPRSQSKTIYLGKNVTVELSRNEKIRSLNNISL